MRAPSPGTEAILLFDGVCNSCDWIVRFVLRRDAARRFRFCRLQSEKGRMLLRECGMPLDSLETLVLIQGASQRTHSSAVFEICRILGWPWKALAAISVLPGAWTDTAYREFAQNRYRLFGKTDSCRRLSPEEKELFLDAEREG
jgi:predicted DCC family thiol-disulfide oxidoreductase YuxK